MFWVEIVILTNNAILLLKMSKRLMIGHGSLHKWIIWFHKNFLRQNNTPIWWFIKAIACFWIVLKHCWGIIDCSGSSWIKTGLVNFFHSKIDIFICCRDGWLDGRLCRNDIYLGVSSSLFERRNVWVVLWFEISWRINFFSHILI